MTVAALAVAGCLAVAAGSDQIVLRDLAPVFTSFDAASADTPVAFAPAPGVRRIFRLPELRQLAARFHMELRGQEEICLERPLAPLNPARLRDAMVEALPGAQVEVLDYLRTGAPDGRIEFSPAGLHDVPGGSLWKGSVRYGGDRRFPIWARVKVRVRSPRLVAAADLKAGRPVEPSQLRVDSAGAAPSATPFASSVEEISGRVPRRTIRAGTALRREWFDAPREVSRGDTVKVEVRSGGARIEMEALAEGSGSAGQRIPVRNPLSKKSFLARVEGRGRVSVGL
jgi:flagellar basal body P-ring formation protein FlgA